MRARGDIGPLAFLHAWARMDIEPGKRHVRENPSSAVVAAVASAREAELRDVLAELAA